MPLSTKVRMPTEMPSGDAGRHWAIVTSPAFLEWKRPALGPGWASRGSVSSCLLMACGFFELGTLSYTGWVWEARQVQNTQSMDLVCLCMFQEWATGEIWGGGAPASSV